MARLKYEYFVKSSLKPQASEFLRTTRQNREVAKYLFQDKKITREQQQEWYTEYSKDEDTRIWLVTNGSVYVGYVTFHIKSLYHRRAEVGYVIHPDFQGQGIGKAMVKWSIKKAAKFEEGVHRLYLTVFPWNMRAHKLYTEAGFQKDGILRQYVFKGGEYKDVTVMSYIFDVV